MPSEWSFGDEIDADHLPFRPGKAYCHHCGTPAPEETPDPNDRCVTCHLHLHACRNCMFDHGIGCLLLSPHRTPHSGVAGQYCPTFIWRDDEVASSLGPDDIASLRGR